MGGDYDAQAASSLAALSAQQQEVSNQLALDEASLNTTQGNMSIAKKRLEMTQQMETAAKKTFRQRSNQALEDPSISTDAARGSYFEKKKARIKAEQQLKSLELQYQAAKVAVDADQGKLTSVNRQSSILREQTLRKEIEKITTVTARGEAGCSEDISFGQCKNAALADAKRKAAEQATSMIESDTRVKDFVVQSDQIHSSVHALVKSIKILKKGTIGDGIGYFYEIEATVQGQYIPAGMPAVTSSITTPNHHVKIRPSVKRSATIHPRPSHIRRVRGLAAGYGGYSNSTRNNKMYLFDGARYVRWQASNSYMDQGYPKSIRSNWSGIPNDLDAAIYAGHSNGSYNNKLYLFKREYYWRWNLETNRMDSGYPKLIRSGWRGVPDNLDAAVYGGYSRSSRNNKLYLFSGAYYYRWDIQSDRLDRNYPKRIRDGWPGIPDNLDMAVYAGQSAKSRNNKLYFFKGDQYWRWDIKKDRLDSGYPRSVSRNWPNLR